MIDQFEYVFIFPQKEVLFRVSTSFLFVNFYFSDLVC